MSTSTRPALTAVSVAFGVILLYFLSPPFLIAIIGEGFLEKNAAFFSLYFWPAKFLFAHFPPYQAYINFTLQFIPH